jgi:hypothetical protein
MAWNKADLRPRVERRAAELKKSVTDVLPKGYSFFADSKAGKSPQVDTLEKIAANLGWSLCELLCEARTDLIKLAVAVAQRAVRSDRAELLPDATVSALGMLEAYEHDGEPIDEAALAHIERNLRVQYRDR